MAGRDEDDQLVLQKRPHHQSFVSDGPRQNAYVLAEAGNPFHHALGIVHRQGDMDLGEFRLEEIDHRRQIIGPDREGAQDLQPPCAKRSGILQRVLRLFRQREDPLGILEQRLSSIRQLDPPSSPVEQADPLVSFKLADVNRHRRLGDGQGLGRLGKTPTLRDRVEDPELIQVHGH